MPVVELEAMFDLSVAELRNPQARPLTEIPLRTGASSGSGTADKVAAIIAALRQHRACIPGQCGMHCVVLYCCINN